MVTEQAPLNSASDHTLEHEGMTLARERLDVTLPVRSRRVRLHRYVETETVTQAVEVRREKLRVEELADDVPQPGTADSTPIGYDWQDHEFELILHEERVVVSTTVVAVERVRVRTRVVTEDTPVSASLDREEVELITEPSAPAAPSAAGSPAS